MKPSKQTKTHKPTKVAPKIKNTNSSSRPNRTDIRPQSK